MQATGHRVYSLQEQRFQPCLDDTSPPAVAHVTYPVVGGSCLGRKLDSSSIHVWYSDSGTREFMRGGGHGRTGCGKGVWGWVWRARVLSSQEELYGDALGAVAG